MNSMLFGFKPLSVRNRAEGSGAAMRDLESIGGENGVALIFVKSCHACVLFP
jgi:hypothetical protein